MKKIVVLFITLSLIVSGCGHKKEYKKNVIVQSDANTIVWYYPQAFGDYSETVKEEVNRLLREEYRRDYQIVFEAFPLFNEENQFTSLDDYINSIYTRRENGIQTDILFSAATSGAIYPKLVQDDIYKSLDDLFTETEAGQKVYSTYPENYWEGMKLDNRIYGFRNTDIQYAWDYTLFANNEKVSGEYSKDLGKEAYSIHTLNAMFDYVHNNSEQTAKINISPNAILRLENYQSISLASLDLLYKRTENGIELVNPFEEELLIQYWKLIADNKDYILPNSDQSYTKIQSGQFSFGYLLTNLENYNGYEYSANQTIAITPIASVSMDVVAVRNDVTGIASWSQNAEQSMDFISLVFTEPQLSNLLCYGIEGVDYLVEEGRVSNLSRSQTTLNNITNKIITYPYGMEPDNKEEVLKTYYDNLKTSMELEKEIFNKITGEDYEKLYAITSSYEGLWYGEYEDPMTVIQEANQRLSEAGIDEFLQKWNTYLRQ